MTERKIRVVVAKPGLDGHDRGAKVVALALRDAGMEVIYTGLHQTVEHIVQITMQEDADVIGLSILSGAHIPITKKLLECVRKEKLENVLIVVGGVIPKKDIETLREMGVDGVFPGGTSFDASIKFIQEHVKQ